MNQTVFPPVLIGDPDLTPRELAAKQASWGSKAKRFFKQAITYTVLASLQLGTLVQTKEAYAQYVQYGAQPTNGQTNPYIYTPPTTALSGYTNDGTLFMGGQRIGNPHQILHDAQIPSFMNITATRYTFTNDPTHGQGTLAQMELATTNGTDSSVLLNRLYLSPTNPYVAGAPGPYPNYQTYQGVLQNAQQANFLLTNANDGKTYAFKTLTAANRQAVDLLIRELPNTSQFKAAADPLGGGTGVRVTQNGDAVALAAYLATVKPYDYSWQPNFGNTFGTTFGQNGGQNPYGGWANSNNFAPDYSEGGAPAQSFQAFIKQLQDDAVANDKKVRSQTSANSLDLSNTNPNSLFGNGYDLFQYGSNNNPNRDLENDFLRRLQAGQLTAGSADYLEANRIAQERYRIAYATRLETGKPLQYSVADAQRKANELNLASVNPNELFGQGFDLFQFNKALRANGDAENVLLARLQSGELTPGSADYLQATQIAQERLRIAYSQSLSPPEPKKVSKWKLIVGAVVGAVLTFFSAGALAPFVASALTAVAGTIVAATSLVVTSIAGVIAGAVGAIASTTISTGSLSEGLKAGGKALVSGSVKAIVAGAIGFGFATAGLMGATDTLAGTISNVAVNTLSGAVSSTILGQGSFADNLKTSAISSVVDAVGKSAANTIGDAFPNPNGTNVANYAAHAVLGCATAAAKGGDCAAGAVGAAAGEVAAATGFLDAAAKSTIGRTLNKDEVVFFGGLVGGTAAAVASKAEDVNANFATGTATASNAVENNYLNHTQQALKDKALLACEGNRDCINKENTKFNAISDAADKKRTDACLDKTVEQCGVMLKATEKDFAPLAARDKELSEQLKLYPKGSPENVAVLDRYNDNLRNLADYNGTRLDMLAAKEQQFGLSATEQNEYRTRLAVLASAGADALAGGRGAPRKPGDDAATPTKPPATSEVNSVINKVSGALPNAEKAIIDPNKLTSYALNPQHPEGGNKAKVFEAALGYNQSNADLLIEKIQQGVTSNPAVMGIKDQFGQRFTVDMPITGPNGNTVMIRTGWILDTGATIPRLATTYVK